MGEVLPFHEEVSTFVVLVVSDAISGARERLDLSHQ